MFGLDEFGAWLIYTAEYYSAQLLWQLARALLLVAVLAQNAESWLTENIGTLVEMMVNALAAPTALFLMAAMAALGLWYTMNALVATPKWVDPSKLITYGTITLFFFGSPLVVVGLLETVRGAAQTGVDVILLSDSIDGMFPDNVGSGDNPIPDPVGVPDVNNDGNIAAFDLVSYLLYIGNEEEISHPEFPPVFAEGLGTFAGFFPHGDPATIELESEAVREEAIALAWNGILQLVYGLMAIPTAIAEHVLWLALTIVAILIYIGLPFGLMLSFFTHTEAWFSAYLRQYVNLIIETFLSICIVAFTVGLLAAAAAAGVGVYIGMSLVTVVIITWRIKGAVKLASASLDLFGGGTITGGARGGDLAGMAVTAVTGGLALATGGTALAGATMLATDKRMSQAAGMSERGMLTGQDLSKTDARVSQLTAVGGYALSHNRSFAHAIESAHEVRTLGRNFAEGGISQHEPDNLDYLRVGEAMGKSGGSQWMAMHLSDSYRRAVYDVGNRQPRLRDRSSAESDEVTGETEAGARVDAPQNQGHGRASRRPSPSFTPPPPPFGSDEEGAMPTADFLPPATNARQPGSGSANRTQTPVPPPSWGAPPQEDAPAWEDEPSTLPAPTRLLPPAIHLQPTDDAVRQAHMVAALGELQAPHSPSAVQVRDSLQNQVGENNTSLLQQAVATHGATAVAQAASAIAATAQTQLAAGQPPAELLSDFQIGDALSSVPADNPLSQEQLRAVADLVLQPRRSVTQTELVTAIGHLIENGQDNDQELATHFGSPVHFGVHTRSIRGVMRGAADMGLQTRELLTIVTQMQQGNTAAARHSLRLQGHRSPVVDNFLNDLALLPDGLTVPQTTHLQEGEDKA